MKFYIKITTLALGLISANAQAAEAMTAIEILMDDSGVLQSPKEAWRISKGWRADGRPQRRISM
jgi:hypothetical protein